MGTKEKKPGYIQGFGPGAYKTSVGLGATHVIEAKQSNVVQAIGRSRRRVRGVEVMVAGVKLRKDIVIIVTVIAIIINISIIIIIAITIIIAIAIIIATTNIDISTG